FAARGGGVDCQTAGRKAVDIAHADSAEITGAEEHYELVHDVGTVDRIVQPETGRPRHLEVLELRRIERLAIFEVAPFEDQRLFLAFMDRMDAYRLLEKPAHVEGLQFERS